MTDFALQILVSKPQSRQHVQLPLSEYLAGWSDGTIDWTPAAESAALSLVVDGEERLADDLGTLGSLRMLTRQLQDARRRIGRGEIGLVRTPDVDVVDPPYFLFEPDDPTDPKRVNVSLLVIDDSTKDHWFPLPAWGLVDPEQLFSYVRAHRARLIETGIELGELDNPLAEVAVPFDQLIAAIDRETALAEQILEIHPEVGMFDDV